VRDADVAHRPWPLPEAPWLFHMRWCDLAFLHWPVDPAIIRPSIPAALEIDTFDGQAWIGVVPFRMENVRPRFAPPIPGTGAFPEINVRTYVRSGARTGVWFFSLDATSRLAVRAARWAFNLPYLDAEIVIASRGESVDYRSRRVHREAPPAAFQGTYRPTGASRRAAVGSLEHFLVERYCLFALSQKGEVGYMDVHHMPWPLQPATAAIEVNTMTSGLAADLGGPPLVHFARSLDVVAWPIVALSASHLLPSTTSGRT